MPCGTSYSRWVLGAKGKSPCGGGHSCFLIINHINGVTQNIQLVSSLLQSYWVFTFEYPCLLEASTTVQHSAFYLMPSLIMAHPTISTIISKHQIQPENGDKQADSGWDCRTRLERPNSQARTGTGK